MTIHSCCWPADPRCCRGPTRCVSGSRQVASGWSATTCATAERRRPSTRRRRGTICAFSALTLVSTRPVAPGPVDDDLPDHDAATMDAVFSRPMPDWTDRSAVAAFAADGAELLGNDPEQARATAARIWDRTPSSEPSVQQ